MRDLSGDAPLSITLFRGLEGLESLRDGWSEIVSGMTRSHFFHLWEWHYSYLRCLAPDPDQQIYFFFSRGKTPLAIFPLHFAKISLGGLRLKTLTFPSHDHMQPCDLVCNGEALRLPLFQILGQHLRNQRESWDMIHLPHLLEGACALRILHHDTPARFLLKQEGRCDFLDASGTYDSFLSSLSRNLRRNLKRAGQCLDELPGVQYAFTQNGPELEERFNAFMDVEASGWKGALGIGTAIKLHPSLRCFYEMLTRELSASGRVSINTLTTEGRCIAAQFCILLGDRAYILKIGYDEDYKRCAPGNLLVALFLKRSMEGGAIRNINLVTDAEWHADWKPKSYDKSGLYIFNATPAGLMGFMMLKFYPILKNRFQRHVEPHLSSRIRKWIGGSSHEE